MRGQGPFSEHSILRSAREQIACDSGGDEGHQDRRAYDAILDIGQSSLVAGAFVTMMSMPFHIVTSTMVWPFCLEVYA